jgi:hypothetical protein
MKGRKAMVHDDVQIEVWRNLGDMAIVWLISIFNHIFWSNKMPESGERTLLVHIFKNKEDIQICIIYRGVKLMRHTMKFWERIIEHRLKRVTNVTKSQFSFMSERPTEAVL